MIVRIKCNSKTTWKTTKNVNAFSWWNDLRLSKHNPNIQAVFIKLISEIETMWDKHLGRMNIAQHRFALLAEDTTPILAVPQRVELEAQPINKIGIAKMSGLQFIDLSQTEWEPLIIRETRLRVCLIPKRNKEGKSSYSLSLVLCSKYEWEHWLIWRHDKPPYIERSQQIPASGNGQERERQLRLSQFMVFPDHL